jgi:hypothetical protein
MIQITSCPIEGQKLGTKVSLEARPPEYQRHVSGGGDGILLHQPGCQLIT